MAELQLNQRWEAWAPTLDGNDKLEKPFLFELTCGLTRAEMRRIDDAHTRLLREKLSAVSSALPPPEMKGLDDEAKRAVWQEWSEKLADQLLAAEVDATATALEPYFRMGVEPLTIAGKPVTSLRSYLEAVSEVADQEALLEPLRALRGANSLGREQVLFSKRRSGGGSTTASRSAAKQAEKTGDR